MALFSMRAVSWNEPIEQARLRAVFASRLRQPWTLAIMISASLFWLGCGGSAAVAPSDSGEWDPLSATTFVFPPAPPDAEALSHVRERPLYVELEKARHEGDDAALGRRILEVREDPSHLQAYSLWLRDQYMYGSAPEALDGLHYFDALITLYEAKRRDLYDASLHDTLVMMVFLSSELLAHENVARCKEQPNGTSYRLFWRTGRGRGAYARRTWDAMSPERRAFTLRFAKARVESAEDRPPSPAACAGGIRALQAAADAGLCRRVPPSPEASNDRVGGSVYERTLCDSDRFATFVDDATWLERRAIVRDRYWATLFSGD